MTRLLPLIALLFLAACPEGTGTPDAGEPEPECVETDDCREGFCVDGECVECEGPEDCDPGFGCYESVCELAYCTQEMCDDLGDDLVCRFFTPGDDTRCCTGSSVPMDGDECCDIVADPDCTEREPR